MGEVVRSYGSIDLGEFSYILEGDYGMAVDKCSLTEWVKTTDLYYNPVAGRVYEFYEANLRSVE